MKRAICFSLGFVFFMLAAESALATVKLFDEKLTLNGYVKEVAFYRTSMQDREAKYHDTNFDFLKTSAGIEALYSIKESQDLTIRFFTGLKWWYEAAPRIDDQYGRSMDHRFKKDYVTPRDFDEDVLNEAYFDFISGPFQVRIGKQIVVWGNLDVDRAADVVNPVDLRHAMFGVDKWEEFKRGIFMIRMFYQTQLPGNLRMEAIFNPGDFKQDLLPLDGGGHYGTPLHLNNPFDSDPSFMHWQFEKSRRDAPGWSTNNYEFGFKLSGYTWDIDWSLIYYNSINGAPIIDPKAVGPFMEQYIFGNILPWQEVGDWPGYRVFKYKRNQIVGGTFEKCMTSGGLLRGSTLTVEWYYDIHSPFNLGTNGDASATYGMIRKNILGGAVKFYQKYNIPGFTQSRICTGKQFEMTITYYFEKIFKDEYDLIQNTRYHRRGDSVADSISVFCMQPMFNYVWTFVFNSYYKPRIGKWFVMPAVRYNFPGKHWSFETGLCLYGGAKNDYTHSVYEHKDSVILKLTYDW